ncbi:hypothetical protein GN956_G4866 [Arapaima gigas]
MADFSKLQADLTFRTEKNMRQRVTRRPRRMERPLLAAVTHVCLCCASGGVTSSSLGLHADRRHRAPRPTRSAPPTSRGLGGSHV